MKGPSTTFGKVVEHSFIFKELPLSYLLHIEVSPLGENSVSRGISQEFAAAWTAAHPEGRIVLRDLAAETVPHLDGEAIFAGLTPEDQRSESMAAKFNYRKELIAEITGADEIIVSAPMWNWSIPSVLKAYFDQIIMSGTLDASRARGLAGKKITFIVAQGGSYVDGAPRAGWDFATGYLKLIAQALGATDVEIIVAEYTLAGIAPGMESFVDAKAASIEAAKQTARNRAA